MKTKRVKVERVWTALGSKIIYEVFVDGKSTGFNYCEPHKHLRITRGVFDTAEQAKNIAMMCASMAVSESKYLF